MITFEKAIAKLELLKKLIQEPDSLSPQEKSIHEEDSPIIKGIKNLLKTKLANEEIWTDSEILATGNKIAVFVNRITFNKEEVNSTAKITVNPFWMDGQEHASEITVHGTYVELSKLNDYLEKQITWKFTKYKKESIRGLNLLTIYYDNSWTIKEVVEVETQTELTYHDINRMEASEKKLLEFLKIDNPKNPIKDEDRKEDCLFRMKIIGRGIASIQEDMEHSKTQGQEMKTKLAELEREVGKEKITETELNRKVCELEQLVKRKETEFQQRLKTEDKDWKKLRDELNKATKLYEENNELLVRTNQEKKQLMTQITAKDDELKKLNEDLEQKEKELDGKNTENNDFMRLIDELKTKTLSDYEETISKKISNLCVNVSALLNSTANNQQGLKDIYYQKNTERLCEELKSKWDKKRTPNISIDKDLFLNNAINSHAFATSYSNINTNYRILETKRHELQRQIEEKDEIIQGEKRIVYEKEEQINELENIIHNREEEIKTINGRKATIEAELKQIKEVDLEKCKKELEDEKKSIVSKDFTIKTILRKEGKLLQFLNFYRSSWLVPIPIKKSTFHLLEDKEFMKEYLDCSTGQTRKIALVPDWNEVRKDMGGKIINLFFKSGRWVSPLIMDDFLMSGKTQRNLLSGLSLLFEKAEIVDFVGLEGVSYYDAKQLVTQYDVLGVGGFRIKGGIKSPIIISRRTSKEAEEPKFYANKYDEYSFCKRISF